MNAVAEAARGDGEHAAELAAAEDADDVAPGRMARECESRSGSQLGGSVVEPGGLCLAKGAETFAQVGPRVGEDAPPPAGRRWRRRPSPMASVPTGTPPGICTIESSESRPLSAWLWTGTPSTGSSVCAATMPGRWAAPPAPAMITSRPRASRAVGVLEHAGRACGGRRRRGDSCGTPNCVEHLGGVAHRLPVGLAAHDHADQCRPGHGDHSKGRAPCLMYSSAADISRARA